MFFLGLTSHDLADNDETRSALFARQMLESGNFLYTTWAGLPYTNKPPLHVWAIASGGWLLGGVGTLSTRFPSALAGVGATLLTLWLGRRLFGPRTGLIGALLFTTNYQVFHSARLAQPDMLLTFFVLLSVTLAVWGLQGARGRAIWGLLFAYGTAALAVLTKGPVGFLLPAFIVLLYLAVYRSWRRAPVWVHPLGGALFFAAAAPWYVLFARAIGGGPVGEGLWRENVSRYLLGHDHPKPLWYYLPDLLLDFLPWSLFLVPALIYAFLQIRRPPVAFLSLWFAVVFIFFSFSGSKRSQYLLPLYPAASLLSAALIEEQLLSFRGAWHRFVSGLFEVSTALLAVGALGGLGAALWGFPGERRAFLPLLAVAAVTGGLAFWRSSLGRWREALGLFVAGVAGLGVVASLWTLPLMVSPKSPVPSAARLAGLASGRQIVAYRFSRPSLQFFGEPRGAEVIYRYGPPDLRELLRSGKPFLLVTAPMDYEGVPTDIRERLKPLDKDFRYGKDRVLVLVPAEGRGTPP